MRSPLGPTTLLSPLLPAGKTQRTALPCPQRAAAGDPQPPPVSPARPGSHAGHPASDTGRAPRLPTAAPTLRAAPAPREPRGVSHEAAGPGAAATCPAPRGAFPRGPEPARSSPQEPRAPPARRTPRLGPRPPPAAPRAAHSPGAQRRRGRAGRGSDRRRREEVTVRPAGKRRGAPRWPGRGGGRPARRWAGLEGGGCLCRLTGAVRCTWCCPGRRRGRGWGWGWGSGSYRGPGARVSRASRACFPAPGGWSGPTRPDPSDLCGPCALLLPLAQGCGGGCGPGPVCSG